MYGDREAADGWQEEYSITLVTELNFVWGEACPNVFHQPLKKLHCLVHGNDFTCVGPKDSLDWYEKEIQKFYEVTIQPRVGPGNEDTNDARVLDRILRWESDRIEYEADPRQVEKLRHDFPEV